MSADIVTGLPPLLSTEAVPAPAAARSTSSWYPRIVKPLLERLTAAVLVALLLPLIGGLALLVLVTMGRPVVFRQHRVGRGGRAFTMYKLRTMGADRRAHRSPYRGVDRRLHHKAARDPRCTPVGRVLRAWSLDELPQLWNVIRGDMGLIGPRPELVDVVARYEAWQHRRHDVRPGLTGLWQVSQRGTGNMEEWTHLDLEYVDRLSLGLDLRIAIATIPAALGRRKGH